MDIQRQVQTSNLSHDYTSTYVVRLEMKSLQYDVTNFSLSSCSNRVTSKGINFKWKQRSTPKPQWQQTHNTKLNLQFKANKSILPYREKFFRNSQWTVRNLRCSQRFWIDANLLRSCDLSAINPLNAELNPICHLLALLGVHFLHVSRIRVKSLTLRLLMSYIQGGTGGMCQTSGGCSLC